jgi:transposase
MMDSRALSVAQIKEFLKIDSSIEFKSVHKREAYKWMENSLTKFRYFRLKKKEKGIVREYIIRMTGLSESQVDRLINRKKKTGKIFLMSTKRHRFPKKYTSGDIARLVETDNLHLRLSGPATRKILEREYGVFRKTEFENIGNVSASHIYNLRETRQYRSHSLTVKKTNPTKIPIGERRKPRPEGKPGFLRVDSVHQGDLEKEKGVYHINITDEITQWEVVGCVERISEYYLEPLLEDLIEQIPFVIINFHSDNGSEFINKVVAKLLNNLLIKQTKSRARRSNDNALAECKNGAVIRKHIGYCHIPRRFASDISLFYKEYFNTYLDYHRPCGYATVITDKKGKEKKVYDVYQVPYERFKSLPDAKQYLKPGITFETLDEIAYQESDNECAAKMQKAKEELFKNFKNMPRELMAFTTFISPSFVD